MPNPKKAYEEFKWKQKFNIDFDAEKVFCYGCKPADKPLSINVKACTVRKCATVKGYDCCIECKELSACDKELWKNEYTQKLYKQWSELPVTLEDIDIKGIKELVKNDSTGKLRLINIWATWCGPCVTEFPDLVIIDRMYRGRKFELITISADKKDNKQDVLNFLKQHQASNKNYIFNNDDVYQMIEAIDPEWQGGLPYTMVIEPGGKIIYRKQDTIDPLQMKKLIVDDKYIGRYY